MRKAFLHFLLIMIMILSGCSGLYFRKAIQEPPQLGPTPLLGHSISEYWTGIVFNGSKIGFSHFRLFPSEDDRNRFNIYSEAYFRFRFLLIDKKVNLQSHDVVAADLSLLRFAYTVELDDSQLAVSGRQTGTQLIVTIQNRGETSQMNIPVTSRVYPTSAILLMPIREGLQIGRHYTYEVFDGQSLKIETVEQSVIAYEESDLYEGPAFKIRTRFKAQTVTTWMDARGMPLLEMSLGGVIISALESRIDAQRYLTQAALNKDEILLDFSLIKSDLLGLAPEQLESMTVSISNLADMARRSGNERQICVRSATASVCQVSKFSSLVVDQVKPTPGDSTMWQRYLRPSFAVASEHPDIQRTARQIAAQAADDRRRVHALIDWMQFNIKREAVDAFTALDVFKSRRAECQGHALLFAAFARSLGIPTRVVNGIVYAPRLEGFLYHSWNESVIDGRWVAVDPIFNQFPADVTHVRLVEGEDLSDLLPLVELIGKIRVDILSVKRLSP